MNSKTQETSLDQTLESIIDQELFEKEEKNFFKKAKQNVEKILIKNKNKILIPASAVIGVMADYASYQLMTGFAYAAQIINPKGAANVDNALVNMATLIGVAAAGYSYILADNKMKDTIGKILCKTKELGKNAKKKKENFIQRNKALLAFGAWAVSNGYIGMKIYEQMNSLSMQKKELLIQNQDKMMPGVALLSITSLVAIYMAFSSLGRGSVLQKSSSWKNTLGYIIYKISKKDGIKYLEEESKKGNIQADMQLSSVKENLSERLQYTKKVVEKMKEEKILYSEGADTVRYMFIGRSYFAFLRKKTVDNLLSLALSIHPTNPEKSINIMNNLSKVKELNLRPEIIGMRNYLLNMYEQDQAEHWIEMEQCALEDDKIEMLKGTEWKVVLSFPEREFVRKNFLFKKSDQEKKEKFLTEVAIWKKLKGTEVNIETPLFDYMKDSIYTMVTLRSGYHNLREKSQNMSDSEKFKLFETILPRALSYQQKMFFALEKEGSEYIIKSEYRNNSQNIIIPRINLEKNLMQRAFKGYMPGEQRLGENEHLTPLLQKLSEYRQQNHLSNEETFNHGDLLTANITEELCFIDPRPRITHPLYDFTHLSVDPVFLDITYDSKKEKIIEMLIKNNPKNKEEELMPTFDYLYIHNGICAAGSRFTHKEDEVTAKILNEIFEFSKGQPFEKELDLYLKNSNVKDLLNLI